MPPLNIHVLATVCDWRKLPSAIGCYAANSPIAAQWIFISKQTEILADVVVGHWQQT